MKRGGEGDQGEAVGTGAGVLAIPVFNDVLARALSFPPPPPSPLSSWRKGGERCRMKTCEKLQFENGEG